LRPVNDEQVSIYFPHTPHITQTLQIFPLYFPLPGYLFTFVWGS